MKMAMVYATNPEEADQLAMSGAVEVLNAPKESGGSILDKVAGSMLGEMIYSNPTIVKNAELISLDDPQFMGFISLD